MGKSPGKWIKTLLLRKKASGSGVGKGRVTVKTTNEKDAWNTGKEPPEEIAEDSSLASLPLAANCNRNGDTSESERGLVPCSGALTSVNPDVENQVTVASGSSNDLEKQKEEQAAVKAQAAFRGFLARRAFRALKGIIRLQALIRGHLVRRQAVATLSCLQGIVKLQALVRGGSVRRSEMGIKIRKTCHQETTQDAKALGVKTSLQAEKLFENAFVRKLLSPSPTVMPLLIQYGKGEPNSAWNWLERWTFTLYLKPLVQPKRDVGSKGLMKPETSHPVEIETSKPKRSIRKNSTANESGMTHLSSELERPKRNLRKVTSHQVDSVQEHPQNELEKVKRSLRKVSNSTTEAPDPIQIGAEKPKRNPKRVSSSTSEVADQCNIDSAEKKKDTTVASEDQLDMETTLKPVAINVPADTLHDEHTAVELHPLEVSGKDENNISLVNGELSSKEDQINHENHKNNRRRSSFPGKSNNSENGIQNTPTLPSYMAATESAKAKLKAQGSPRFGQDGSEKNGLTRRHSLPSATNGKVNSPSARAQRLVQASGKGGLRSDRSLLSSRDGNEKVIQTEWRR